MEAISKILEHREANAKGKFAKRILTRDFVGNLGLDYFIKHILTDAQNCNKSTSNYRRPNDESCSDSEAPVDKKKAGRLARQPRNPAKHSAKSSSSDSEPKPPVDKKKAGRLARQPRNRAKPSEELSSSDSEPEPPVDKKKAGRLAQQPRNRAKASEKSNGSSEES